MTFKWLLAIVFIDELPWPIIHEAIGLYGTIAVYALTVWGEIVLYAALIYKVLNRRKGDLK